ncbi:UNVERIFIED_CONTAM: Universal stress protein PHOS34 [Sesamum radiatum]|uniref:Universal stress protein PHOS34 n=1 Tax=Sesamum radiatum TaxID=300843 RepID=A0AAW2KKJ1_SESRA
MASAPPATAAVVVVDHPNHDLHPVQVKTSSPRFPPPAGTPTSSTASSPSTAALAAVTSAKRAHTQSNGLDTSACGLGPFHPPTPTSDNSFIVTPPQQTEEEYDNFTAAQANILAQPLVDAYMPVKIHIVKDHDMKERLCLEVERLGLSAVIMGSRGLGPRGGAANGKLGNE